MTMNLIDFMHAWRHGCAVHHPGTIRCGPHSGTPALSQPPATAYLHAVSHIERSKPVMLIRHSYHTLQRSMCSMHSVEIWWEACIHLDRRGA